MKKSKKIIVLVLIFCSTLSFSLNVKENSQNIPNLFDKYNPHFYSTKQINNLKVHKYISNDSATSDGSGCILISPKKYFHWFRSAKVFLKKNKIYTVSLSLKMLGSQTGESFRGQNVMIGILGNSKWRPSYWNVSKENQWEEVLFQFIAEEDKYYQIGVATFQNSFSKEKYNIPNQRPPLTNKDNFDKSVNIYIDDIFITEADNVIPQKKVSKKVVFTGEKVKIDQLGNWSTRENGKWKAIFPKLIYPGNHYTSKSNKHTPKFIYHFPAKKYADHGFNGVADVTYAGYVENAIMDSNGRIKYFSKQLNTLERLGKDKNNSLSFQYRLKGVIEYLEKVKYDGLKINDNALYLMHSFDNENDWVQDYKFRDDIEAYLQKTNWDNIRNQRKSPVYMLNGTYGVTRANRNENRNIMDVTGSYIGGDSLGNVLNVPVSTLDIINKTQYQVVPGSFIQLQCHYHDKFIPSLFYGIIQGGTAVAVWKDGTTLNGCTQDFSKNSWASALKNVFDKIDKLLPIIRTDRNSVTWNASSSDFTVKIGKRDFEGKHYLIISHYGEQSKHVNIKLTNLDKVLARDYFTKEALPKVVDNHLEVFIKSANDGYRVIELY